MMRSDVSKSHLERMLPPPLNLAAGPDVGKGGAPCTAMTMLDGIAATWPLLFRHPWSSAQAESVGQPEDLEGDLASSCQIAGLAGGVDRQGLLLAPRPSRARSSVDAPHGRCGSTPT